MAGLSCFGEIENVSLLCGVEEPPMSTPFEGHRCVGVVRWHGTALLNPCDPASLSQVYDEAR